MVHKGIPYSVAATVEPDIWQWQFQIGESIRTGKTNTRLAALAARRVQMKIDAALRVSGVSSAIQSDSRAPGQRTIAGAGPVQFMRTSCRSGLDAGRVAKFTCPL